MTVSTQVVAPDAPMLAAATAAATVREPARAAVLRGLAYGGLLLALLLAALTIVLPTVLGAVPLTVLSNSMAPGLPAGSLAIVQPTKGTVPADGLTVMAPDAIRDINDTSGITAGDIIVFQPHGGDATLVMHRVQSMSSTVAAASGQISHTFTTRGDALTVDDAPVADHQVRGVVLYSLPLLGYVNNALNAGGSARWVTGLVVIAGYGVAIYYATRALRASRPSHRG
ncbi:MAG: S26 family signal peptidase [Cellulomonadaceae bacterium]|jgi:signal peptidase|nr:S26 family signal peptidase [Cellulomonadaceae bacterium]